MLKQKGLTLIEILITLAIATILISTTAPSLMSTIQNNRMVSLHNDLLSDLALTRNTAVTRGNSATICASNPRGTQCQRNKKVWSNGWLIFDDINNNGIRNRNETIIAVKKGLPDQLKMIVSTPRISYNSEGNALGFSGEFAFCDDRGEAAKKGLIVSNSGRSRVAEANEITVTCQ